MSGRVNLLGGLLAVQLVIIAAVLLMETGFGEAEQGPWLSFERTAVDEIRITGDGEDAAPLVLTRADDGWRLPSGLPANADKIDEVLDKLAALEAPWPVATSGGAAGRFEVSEDSFQRHVELLAGGDTVADVYLGTSPGYQQVHARRADDAAVYSVGLSNYQLPPREDDWLDKTLLQPDGEISAVQREGGWALRRAEEGWLLGDQAADQEAAEDLVRRVRELRVTGVAEAPAEDAEPAAVIAVTDQQGRYRLRLFGGADGEPYRVRSERHEGVFSLANYLADQLLVEEQTLVASADDAAQDADGSAGSSTEASGQTAEGAPADPGRTPEAAADAPDASAGGEPGA